MCALSLGSAIRIFVYTYNHTHLYQKLCSMSYVYLNYVEHMCMYLCVFKVRQTV